MTKVIFNKPFDFRPEGDHRSIFEFLPSEEPKTVTRECAAKAVKVGAATYYKKPESKKNAKRKPKTKTED